ncbi:hypothetical protein AAFF_G00001540 [Aldrovandia affinis]|uniref:Urotensin-2B n=1 Tax=Aldrovandia affinis TaxID=143900 RepID=A0AAD7TCW9_9TELE|nr:hypothetical protein AAFF_G00001540 [Aldrovandia affinis]
MDRTLSVNLCFGLVALLLLHRALTVQGRSILSPGHRVFHPKEETDVQNKVIAFLLRKNLVPLAVERNDLEMASNIAELEELENFKENLELQRELASDAIRTEMSLPRKRGMQNQSCFWKYCV